MPDNDDQMKDLGAFIRDRRNQVQLSLRKLSEAAGISNPYLSQIERGLRRPSAEILRQLANALSISSETLYIRAGILDERPEGPDVVGTIERDPFLTEEQRSSLIGIYQSFRVTNGNALEPMPKASDDAAEADRAEAEVDADSAGADVGGDDSAEGDDAVAPTETIATSGDDAGVDDASDTVDDDQPAAAG